MLSMILQDLRISPMRNFLTGFSMFFGIIAMIMSVLIGTVGSDYLKAKNEQLTGKVPAYSITVSGWTKTEAVNVDELNKKIYALGWSSLSLQYVAEVHGLGFGATDEEARLNLLRGGIPQDMNVNIVSESYRGVYNWPMTQGQWLPCPNDASGFSVVINKVAAERGYSQYVAFNDNESLDEVTGRVVGVVNDGADFPNIYIEVSQAVFYAPYLLEDLAPAFMFHPQISGVVGEDVRSFLSDALFDTTGGKVETVVRVDNSGSYAEVIKYLQIAFTALAILLLLVSVIGLLNVGLVSVEQRSHELLIRRAIGASRMNIAVLVVGSLVLLSVVVCAVAVGVSMLLVESIPLWLEKDTPVPVPSYPIRAAWMSIGVSVGAAMLAGFIPAIKAARLEPALALR